MEAAAKFQLRAKHVSLTYPRCDLDKNNVLERLVAKCGDNLSGALVVAERHADGSPHIHAYLRFSQALSTRDPRYFDLDNYHPNVQCTRSYKNWISYCLKEDQTPAIHRFSLEELKGIRKPTLGDLIATRLDSGATTREVYLEFPGFFMSNLRKIREFVSWSDRESIRRSKADYSTVSELRAANAGSRPIAEWLTANIRKPRPLRSPQLWLYSVPGAGKTSLIMELEKYLNIYWVPYDTNGFLENFDNDYDLIVFDEFKAQFKLTWLNQFIVGSPMFCNIKGGSVLKRNNIPCIFLSNNSPIGCYPKESPQRDAFMDRLEIVNCDCIRLDIVHIDLNE